jgi:hypothetical protein
MTSETTPAPDGLKILRSILTDVRLVLAAVVAIFLGGFAALAQIQGVAEKTAKMEVQAVDASVKTLQARGDAHESQSGHVHQMLQQDVSSLKAEVTQTRTEVEGLRRDLRFLFPTLPRSIDGGAP